MKIIKLSATNSTNSFLKELAQNSALKNFTTVTTDNQQKGRGQQENKWLSEPYKNLTFSTFVIFSDLKVTHQKYLNFAISLSIYDFLKKKKLSNISIKWPNDIMSFNKKICGILVENTFTGDRIKNSVIGIGLNINQEVFPEILQNKATSLKIETAIHYNLNTLLEEFLEKLKSKINLLNENQFHALEENYLKVLYKKNIPTMFKNSRDEIFMGIISGISISGKLQILLEDDSIKEFGIKEITFL